MNQLNAKRGRPAKYLDDASRAAARRDSRIRSYHRRVGQSRLALPITAMNTGHQFVEYMPHPPDVPSNTDPAIGFHINPGISIPNTLNQANTMTNKRGPATVEHHEQAEDIPPFEPRISNDNDFHPGENNAIISEKLETIARVWEGTNMVLPKSTYSKVRSPIKQPADQVHAADIEIARTNLEVLEVTNEDDLGLDDDMEAVQYTPPRLSQSPSIKTTAKNTKLSRGPSQRNNLDKWVQKAQKPPGERQITKPNPTPGGTSAKKTHTDKGGRWIIDTTGLAIFQTTFYEFMAERVHRSTNEIFGCEWVYHGIYAWNLLNCLQNHEYLPTDELLCGIRIVIEQTRNKERQINNNTTLKAITLAHTIQVEQPYYITLSQNEIEAIREQDVIIIPLYYGSTQQGSVGHWVTTVILLTQHQVLVLDSLNIANHHIESTTQKLQHFISQIPQHLPFTLTTENVRFVQGTRQNAGWTCGVIVLEHVRRVLSLLSKSTKINPSVSVDWTSQEEYAKSHVYHQEQMCDNIAVEFWKQNVRNYLNLSDTETTVSAVQSPSPPSLEDTRQSTPTTHNNNNRVMDVVKEAGDGTLEDVADILSEEWARLELCSREKHEEENSGKHANHTECSSLEAITERLQGCSISSDRRLPNVLESSEDLLTASGRKRLTALLPGIEEDSISPISALSSVCKTAFEGTTTSNTEMPEPPTLCMYHHHSIQPQPVEKNAHPEVQTSLDIDSMCIFPKSLAVAQLGINFYPITSITLNQSEDVHLGVEVKALNGEGVENHALHTIPNQCIARVIGITETYLWVFFPALLKSGAFMDPKQRTIIPREQAKEWYDEVVRPSMSAVIDDANILQYIPRTYDAAQSMASANREGISAQNWNVPEYSTATNLTPDASRSRLMTITIQNQYLADLWTAIVNRAEKKQYFRNCILYMGSKNTKLSYMNNDISKALGTWRKAWNNAVDEEYIDPDATFIDIGRQFTPSFRSLDGGVLLWRKCCLDSLFHARQKWSRTQNKVIKENPKLQRLISRSPNAKANDVLPYKAEYPWATCAETGSMTICTRPGSWERHSGLVYTQYYNLIKIPFDSAKQYPFQNAHLEALALDPAYMSDRHQATRGTHININTIIMGYRLSKIRVARALEQSAENPLIYGVRAEDRVSLTLLRRIEERFSRSGTSSIQVSPEAPFYKVRSEVASQFLISTINRYCVLFEYIRSNAGIKFSLPETVVMAIALRGLRFCYGSGLIAYERVLWSDRWVSKGKTKDGEPKTIKNEGLGMKSMTTKYGFGWWKPDKFDWKVWRFPEEINDRLAIGNALLREKYTKQWRIINDIRDVYFRVWQASQWIHKYAIHEEFAAKQAWLDYLYCTVIDLFDVDTWGELYKAIKKDRKELVHESQTRWGENNPPPFNYDTLQSSFIHAKRDTIGPPHLVTGNKSHTRSIWSVVQNLLGHNQYLQSRELRQGWEAKPYRIAIRQSIEIIAHTFGMQEAMKWHENLMYLVIITHWILPWPDAQSLLSHTKQSEAQNLVRRTAWVSVAAEPAHQSVGRMYGGIAHGKINNERNGVEEQEILSSWLERIQQEAGLTWHGHARGWPAHDLLGTVKDKIPWKDLQVGAAVSNVGGGRLHPVVEKGQPPRLRWAEALRNKSLGELEQKFKEILMYYSSRHNARPVERAQSLVPVHNAITTASSIEISQPRRTRPRQDSTPSEPGSISSNNTRLTSTNSTSTSEIYQPPKRLKQITIKKP